jgi:replication-associated recombination protein RarA
MLQEKVVINENGVRKTVTKLEAAIKQLVNNAASGDLRALRLLVDLARDAEAKKEVTETQKTQIGELDEEVIAGILKRFQGDTEQKQE